MGIIMFGWLRRSNTASGDVKNVRVDGNVIDNGPIKHEIFNNQIQLFPDLNYKFDLMYKMYNNNYVLMSVIHDISLKSAAFKLMAVDEKDDNFVEDNFLTKEFESFIYQALESFLVTGSVFLEFNDEVGRADISRINVLTPRVVNFNNISNDNTYKRYNSFNYGTDILYTAKQYSNNFYIFTPAGKRKTYVKVVSNTPNNLTHYGETRLQSLQYPLMIIDGLMKRYANFYGTGVGNIKNLLVGQLASGANIQEKLQDIANVNQGVYSVNAASGVQNIDLTPPITELDGKAVDDAKRAIYQVYSMPVTRIDSSGQTFNNVSESNSELYATIKHYIDSILHDVNKVYKLRYPEFAGFKAVRGETSMAEQLAQAEVLEKLSNVMQINEQRARVGLDDIEEGDLLVSTSTSNNGLDMI